MSTTTEQSQNSHMNTENIRGIAMEKTVLDLIKEYVENNSPDASEEEKEKKIRSLALSLLRV